ncbi:MAG TPA: cupin domain-containing protein [Actinomycetota bacterium]|jgi:uncharacterized RmlC-like cupin family protein|nr:cupin domain-containing protein [Actinomycetota bacterium]
MSQTVRVLRAQERRVPAAAQTPGMRREEALSEEGIWLGLAKTDPGTISGWHHHNGHDSYFYVLSGGVRLEFGASGKEVVEAHPGDWVHVPKDVVHREGNPTSEDAWLALVRVGSGEVVVNVGGPD